MSAKKEKSGQERREFLIELLKKSSEPLKAAQLAKITEVSRQVIVQDMALLRAKEEPVLSTSQGYIYFKDSLLHGVRRVIFSRHSAQDTERELTLLVDFGVQVLDVGIEHSVYGRILRPLNLKSRLDVKNFLSQMTQKEATLLSSLTSGLHLHTLEAPSVEVMDKACKALEEEGFWVET
ncbi:transcription repressor NadR [Desulfitobacterium metallireducens]|uniref:Transcriptional regulator n=1 Tax=Desulfitobacterium metallireducens DSM 15288 TaxID=871968 RepID=W0E5Q8_9FIRM|nr:transcription repressor NadR [Desulfitobacterium metallireducens]AHF06092.1 transcriptional regulator [Desulfitobacterium metallireducens DSM 15288]